MIYAISIPLFRTYILGPAPQLMDFPRMGDFFVLDLANYVVKVRKKAYTWVPWSSHGMT